MSSSAFFGKNSTPANLKNKADAADAAAEAAAATTATAAKAAIASTPALPPSSPLHGTFPESISADDINSVNSISSTKGSPIFNINNFTKIETKVRNAINFFQNHEGGKYMNYTLDAKEYNKIYVTSDIHADLRRFVSMLQLAGLIDTTVDTTLENSGEIYNADWIANIKWIGGSNVLLVIIGDLVDGRRPNNHIPTATGRTVQDMIGSFEFLLHIFIYNLRLSAIKAGSDIRFTIGNHDFSTVININVHVGSNDSDTIIDDPSGLTFIDDKNDNNYVHFAAYSYFNNDIDIRSVMNSFSVTDPTDASAIETAKTTFFTNLLDFIVSTSLRNKAIALFNRSTALKPFYDLMPFYYLRIINDSPIPDVEFVHGGLHHTPTNQDHSEFLNKYQDAIFHKMDTIYNKDMLDKLNNNNGPIWIREYIQGSACIPSYKINHKLIIVGHCPTHVTPTNKRIYKLKNVDAYTGCGSTKNCVYTDCGGSLALVDVASSAAMTPDSDHPVEMLYLEHINSPSSYDFKDGRYYNRMKRIVLDPSSKTSTFINFQKDLSVQLGGTRHFKRQLKKNRTRRRRRRQRR